MRPYRAKRKDNGEWVYGWYMEHPFKGESENKSVIVQDERPYEVHPKTVTQQVCKDKHGKDVYAGDRIRRVQCEGDPRKRDEYEGVVYWHAGFLQWSLKVGSDDIYTLEDLVDSEIFEAGIEIVGNIFDK